MAGIAIVPAAAPDERPQPASRLRRAVGVGASLLALGIGLLVLGAWWVRPSGLEASLPRLMKVNTALCVTSLGWGMLRVVGERNDEEGRLRRVLGALVCAIAGATLAQYAAGVDLGLDQILAADPSASLPGRMSPWSAVILALLGSALVAHRAARLDWVADVALLGAGAALQLVSAGHLYGAMEFYGIDPLSRVAPQTLLSFGSLWIALIAARLGRGTLAIATRRTPGGAAVRLLLPLALVLPTLLGWLRFLAEYEGLVTPRSGVAFFAAAQTLLLAVLIYAFAHRLDAAEARFLGERSRRVELERLIAICAWTGQVRWQGRWVRVEQYLAERWNVQVTHTISEEAMQRMEAEIEAMESGPTEERSAQERPPRQAT